MMSYPVSAQNRAAADEDAVLATASREGDLDAFEELVRRHQKRMFNIAFRISGNPDDASEITQDAFVAAYRHIGSFRAEAKFSTWLTSILINHARNRLKQTRSRQRHEAYSLDEPVRVGDGELLPDPPSGGPSALDRLEQRDRQKAVQDCIHALEPKFREVLVLRDLQDLSYGEIGNVLKTREGTVKSRLFRARESIKDCLKKSLGDIL
ncbi:MAG TPA: sigma-70 family RNA polymerase sigma factor [Nitrospirota bacterium]|nr:sigma-70 family RNA polymerase sigma factor [Nitrospirota bacterium]